MKWPWAEIGFQELFSFSKTREQLTILELSELLAVLAEPSDRRTVNAAARCLKASVSGPPPATSNSCLSRSIEAYVLPEPLVPVLQDNELPRTNFKGVTLHEKNKLIYLKE